MTKHEIIKYLLIILLMIAGVAADFHSKRWAESTLKGKQPTTAISGLLELGFVENKGMIFGILNKRMPETGKTVLATVRIIIIILLSAFMVRYRRRNFLFHAPFILIWSGAIGNLIDPFLYGYVVDFIHLHLGTRLDWPFFFNLADAYVTVGITILLIFSRHFNIELSSPRQLPKS